MPRDVVVVARRLRAAAASARLASHHRARARAPRHAQRAPSRTSPSLVFDHFRREYRRALVARVPGRPRPARRRRRAARAHCRPLGGHRRRSDRRRRRSPAARPRRPSGRTSSPRGCAGMPEVRAALDRMWPVLSGTELVHDLFGFDGPHPLRGRRRAHRRGAARCCSATRGPDVADVAWTEADLALVDEADSLLGPPSAARPRSRRRGRRDSDARAGAAHGRRARRRCVHQRGRRRSPATAATRRRRRRRRRRAAHLRSRARRRGAGPHRDAVADAGPSLPVGVDDARRRLRPGQPARARSPSWDDVIANLPVRVPPHRVTLTVNYRTPAEIMDVANRLLPAAAPGVEPARPVRSTGAHPEVRRGRARRARRAAAPMRPARSSTQGGTVAVIAPVELHAALTGRAGRPRRGGRRRRGHRRAHRGARRPRLQGPRVRPRRRGRAARASSPPTGPGCGCSTSCSPAPPAASSSCTPSRCPRRWSSATPYAWGHDLHHRSPIPAEPTAPPPTSPGTSSPSSTAAAPRASTRSSTTPRRGAHALASYRGRIGELDAEELAELMRELAAIGELGRPRRFVRGPAVRGRHRRSRHRRAHGPRRGARHRDQQRAHLRRARVGRGRPTSRPTRCSPTTGSRSAVTTSRRPAATARTC